MNEELFNYTVYTLGMSACQSGERMTPEEFEDCISIISAEILRAAASSPIHSEDGRKWLLERADRIEVDR